MNSRTSTGNVKKKPNSKNSKKNISSSTSTTLKKKKNTVNNTALYSHIDGAYNVTYNPYEHAQGIGNWSQYYLSENGAMKTGWLNENGTWYYLDGSGAMVTGWLNDRGTWYYLDSSGAMVTNRYIGGYYVNSQGIWVP